MSTFDVDWSQEGATGLPAPGVYAAEVKEVQTKRTKDGHPMLGLRLVRSGTSNVLCFDNLVLGGGGLGIALAKLIELGCERGKPVDPASLYGKRVAVSINHREYDGKTYAQVDIRAPAPFKCGYLSEAAATEAGMIGADRAIPAVDETPF